jgi:hypothetical protein
MKELQPNPNPEDQVLMERLLSAGQIKLKYAVRMQTVLLRQRGKSARDIADFLNIH